MACGSKVCEQCAQQKITTPKVVGKLGSITLGRRKCPGRSRRHRQFFKIPNTHVLGGRQKHPICPENERKSTKRSLSIPSTPLGDLCDWNTCSTKDGRPQGGLGRGGTFELGESRLSMPQKPTSTNTTQVVGLLIEQRTIQSGTRRLRSPTRHTHHGPYGMTPETINLGRSGRGMRVLSKGIDSREERSRGDECKGGQKGWGSESRWKGSVVNRKRRPGTCLNVCQTR